MEFLKKIKYKKVLKELKSKVKLARKNNKNYDYEFHKEKVEYDFIDSMYSLEERCGIGFSNVDVYRHYLWPLMKFEINDTKISGYAIDISLYHSSEYLMRICFGGSRNYKCNDYYTNIKNISLKVFNYKTGEVYCTCSKDFYKEYYEKSKNEFNEAIENGVSFNMDKYKNFDKWCLKEYCANKWNTDGVISDNSPYLFDGVKIDEVRMHVDFDLLDEYGNTYTFSLRNLR